MAFALTSLLLLLLLGGVAIKANELKITSAEELIDFSNNVNNRRNYSGTTIYLDSDIDFTPSLSQQFVPIGNSTTKYYFQGTFDGQGHTISNLNLNSATLEVIGLFGRSFGATIKNFVVDESCSFSSSSMNSSLNVNIGSVAGQSGSSVIESIVNMGSVAFIGNKSGALWIGGIAGQPYESSTIRNCVNYGSVTNSGIINEHTDVYIGGIAGKYNGGTTIYIQNCANYGTITNNGESNDLYMGGIIGENWLYVIIENCVSAGRIVNSKQASGSNYIGSVIGHNTSEITITHCLWTSDVGYNNVYGYQESGSIVTVTNSSLKELTKETVDELNEYAEKNSTWNKWLMLHLNGGRINNISQETLVVTQKHFPDPVKEGSVFSFWCKDAGCSEKYDSNTTDITEITDLYAGWNKNTITFIFNSTKENEVRALNFNETIAYPENPTREGFIFNGWSPNPETMPAENITVTAQWEANSYNITFELGDRIIGTKNVTYENKYGALPSAERIGYTFAGWFTEKEEGKGKKITKESTVSIAKDHTLYAQWSINNYTITFIFDNGKENDVRTLNFNETIAYPENLTREGYIFNGWSPKPTTMPAENITVTAQWIEVTPELVEIVFEKKDLKEEEAKDIIKEYTQEDFIIEKFEADDESGEILVIIKFEDRAAAENFVETIKASSNGMSGLKSIGFIQEAIGSSSVSFYLGLLGYVPI